MQPLSSPVNLGTKTGSGEFARFFRCQVVPILQFCWGNKQKSLAFRLPYTASESQDIHIRLFRRLNVLFWSHHQQQQFNSLIFFIFSLETHCITSSPSVFSHRYQNVVPKGFHLRPSHLLCSRPQCHRSGTFPDIRIIYLSVVPDVLAFIQLQIYRTSPSPFIVHTDSFSK